MKTGLLIIGFLLLAGNAMAQQKPAKPAIEPVPKAPLRFDRLYPAHDAPLLLTDLAPMSPAPGSYRAEPYALRVVVPAPHPDSAAVVRLSRKQPERMPQESLPKVRLVPERPRQQQ
ncbi:hypothetical protein [Hymenobacter jeollabukensis]|uniref:DUF2782 domain-containing protein n=1 Tax=Hymenobacter jeollabukensis TaxID=2025313 RepID=A0A5R8WW39_9BACT|nr:hypothetical protein [Hymenobacter jeollabukensis]TLM96718.1 hypothetical protein FDY95_01610 [Hymenobacter jeollabukensis]